MLRLTAQGNLCPHHLPPPPLLCTHGPVRMYATEWTERDGEDAVFDVRLPHPFDRLVKEPVCFDAENGCGEVVLSYLTELIQTSMDDQPVQYVPIDLYHQGEEEGADEVEEEVEEEGDEEEEEEYEEEVEEEEEEEYEETDDDFELDQE